MYPIPRSDICMSDAMPFSQHWEARVPVPIKEIGDVGHALHAAYSSLRPGDSITICSFESKNWTHLLEVANFRIASMENSKIEVLQVGGITRFTAPKKEVKIARGDPLLVIPVNNTYEVRDEIGNTLEVFVDKRQADDFARREGTKRAAA